MKIRDLNINDYVIVYDLGKSEHSEGMTVVGKFVGKGSRHSVPFFIIRTATGQEYTITDDNYFDLWSNYIESKTESVSENVLIAGLGIEKSSFKYKQSNDLQQRKRKNIKLIDSETVEFENGKQMKVIVNNGKQPTSVYWIDNTTIGFDNGSRVRIPENYATEYLHDTVNHPSHYNYGDIEVIDFIEQVTKHYNPNVAYHIGNAIKYLARSPHKNGKEDVDKARWYIERAFENWDVK